MTGKIEYSSDFLKNLANGAGYDSNSSIAELLDNSIGATANVIKITSLNGHFKIEDIGENAGMNEKTLRKNFFFGGNSSTKNISSAAGKFGVGGKTGILTIIGEMDTDVEITTHKKGSKPIYAVWEVKKGRSNDYYYEFLNDETMPYGTTIEFDCNKDVDEEGLINFISIVYCWVIENGTKIYVNDKLVTSNDPLYRYNHNVINKKLYTSKTFKINKETVEVNITSFNSSNIIPEQELHSWDCGGSKKKTVTTANRSGIYVRTEGRYYTLGNNFDKIMGGTAHASLDGLRIEVCIPKSLWNIIGITWNKGKEISSFIGIESFNTGDIKTGVADYIKKVMNDFKNDKNTTAEKNANKVSKSINDVIDKCNVDAVNVKVIASDNKKGDFINFNDNVLTFDTSSTTMNQKEIQSVAKYLIVIFNEISKKNDDNMIENITSKLNTI